MSELDDLLMGLVERKEKLVALQAEIDEAVFLIDKLAGAPDVKSGTLKLAGDTLIAVVTRKENVTYSDKDGLARLVAENAGLGELFRIELKEKGKKVANFLDIAPNDKNAIALAAIRVVKPAKPSIDIKPRGKKL